MKVRDITSALEAFAPLSLQESYDNAGLIVGAPDDEVSSALLCVDITEEVMDEAERVGADMVISHHPVIFHPLKRLNGASCVERVVARALRRGIALYAAHTNLDSTPQGMSYELARILGVEVERTLELTRGADSPAGFGIVGMLPAAEPAEAFMRRMKQTLGVGAVRHSDVVFPEVRRVAICTGSGASLLGEAKRSGAQIYVAADFRYNDFLDAGGEIIIADVGHFESEYCAINLMYDVIKKKMPNFALRKSVNSRNPVNYLV